jgi:hypothetical protein
MRTRSFSTGRCGRVGALAGVCSAVLLIIGLTTPAMALTEDTGYWYGADSGGPGPSNGSPPYTMPSCGSGRAYGGYIGKIGGADMVSSSNPTGYGPNNTYAWNSADSGDANTNHFDYSKGVGTSGFWFMYGPGDTDGTGDSAYNWGQQQGKWAAADWERWYSGGVHRMPLRILWADVEENYAGEYGWSTSDTSANRDVFNGFYDAVNSAGDGLSPGVYSTNYLWDQAIMAGNSGIPSTWEWTAQVSRASTPSPCPVDYGGGSFYADFFGGQVESSAHAAIWQWSLGTDDYDQINSNKSLPD